MSRSGAARSDVRLNVLGPLELLVDGRPELVSEGLLTKILTLLALAPHKGLAAEVLASEAGAQGGPKGLEKPISRLRSHGLGDALSRKTAGFYRLELDAGEVDARRLVRLADQLEAGLEVDDAQLTQTMALWRGDPAEAAGLAKAHSATVRKARDRLLVERARRNKPRILVLDDKVGEAIRSYLGGFRVTLMNEVKQFWDSESSVDRYDVVLVDLHLKKDDTDGLGLGVLTALLRSAVPAILMTYRPIPGPSRFVERYNLLGYYVKPGNDPDTDFSGLRILIEELVGDGVDGMLLGRLDQELARLERKAGKVIELEGGGPVARSHMRRQVDEVRAVIRDGGSLVVARRRMAEFTQEWLPREG